jgi:Domain of unknown function (DUF5710)
MNTTANINLKVPFAEKDQAKSLGARWNGELKVWYVPPGTDSAPFAKWFTDAAPAASAASPAPKKAASKSTSSFDNIPPQSLDGLSHTAEDAEIDAINAMLREASEV